MGFIFTIANLPTPLCSVSSSTGVAEPVKIYWLVNPLLSTEYLTALHNFGAICHSSISLGFSPSNSKDGLVLANSI